MTTQQFNEIVVAARLRQDKLLKTKGDDYTRHDQDRLSNFKRLAKDLDLSPIKVWAVYAGKHWDALMAFIKTGKAESEAIEGRFDDLHNYLYLLEGLLEDEKQEQPKNSFYNREYPNHFEDWHKGVNGKTGFLDKPKLYEVVCEICGATFNNHDDGNCR